MLFEDAHVIAIDKPAGILSVAPSRGSERNLADGVRRRQRARGADAFPVHRLDRDTSGVLLFAKTPAARAALEQAFRERTIGKRYLALVHGGPREDRGVVRSFIADLGDVARSSRTPIPGGRPAVTRYVVLRRLAGAALLQAEPETGRFNQIRLHCADLGCPLVGERKYAVASRYRLRAKRPLLHAAELTFPHPATGAATTVAAPLPDDFQAVLDAQT